MKIQYRSNLCGGITSILFGIILFILVPMQVGTEYSATHGITSRSVPYALAVVFILCGTCLVIQSVVLKKDQVKELELKKELKVLAYIGVLFVYAFLFQYSFVFSSSFLGVSTLLFTRSKKKLFYIIVLVTVVVLYLSFTQLLHVRLP